jgi:acyl-CoA synthetase (AMP-forming)/AMP-acid ligase II
MSADHSESGGAQDLWSCFERTVAAHGDREAIVSTGTSTTFGAWYARAAGFRRIYRNLGIEKADRILVRNRNTPATAAALTAAWAEGAIAVLVDESATPAQVEHVIRVTEPKVIVTDHSELPGAFAPQIPVIVAETVGSTPMPDDNRSIVSTDYASIVFTSGSTGLPKGVIQSHGNLVRGCKAVAAYSGLSEQDRILCLVPWSFDYGYGQLLTSVVLGATMAVPEPVTPSAICSAIEELRPTIIGGVSSAYGYLVSGLSPIEDIDRSSVRLIMNTGGRVPRNVLNRLRELFTDANILLNYGLTESYRSCYLPPELLAERPDSIGLPIPGVDIVIVDEAGGPVPWGQEGEIVHRGDLIFHGYWNDPDATKAALRADPLGGGEARERGRALFTGDMGYRDADGFIYFSGRRDQQLKSMGVRVSPAEIEDLFHDSGLVAQVAVFGVNHDLFGHEIWAAVVPSLPASDARAALQRFAREAMTRYMEPRRYLVYESLPLTQSGKVDYEVLREAAAECPSPSPLMF